MNSKFPIDLSGSSIKRKYSFAFSNCSRNDIISTSIEPSFDINVCMDLNVRNNPNFGEGDGLVTVKILSSLKFT